MLGFWAILSLRVKDYKGILLLAIAILTPRLEVASLSHVNLKAQVGSGEAKLYWGFGSRSRVMV